MIYLFPYFPLWDINLPSSGQIGFGRDWVEIVPRSLPELFEQLGDQNNSQKHPTNENRNLRWDHRGGYMISRFLTWNSDSSWKTAHIDNWACLESLNFNFTIFSKFWISFVCGFGCYFGPRAVRKLRETPGKKIHQVSSKSEPGCPSYDRRNQ